MHYAYTGLKDALAAYEKEHGRLPAVIALGKTQLEDLQNWIEVKADGIYFEGIDVIRHNDPIGVLLAHMKG